MINIDWELVLPWILIFYVLFVIYTAIRIIMDTQNTAKALIYFLMVVFVPVIGIIVYYSIGVNYRKHIMYSKRLNHNFESAHGLEKAADEYKKAESLGSQEKIGEFAPLVNLINKQSPLASNNNNIELLINGEEKFPRLLEDLQNAKHHIHLEYYIYEENEIGKQVAEIIKQKAREGVQVRFMYDDFGSKSLKKRFIRELEEAGVEVSDFYKISLFRFGSTINYRNHRKIVVIDGVIGYVGGINISDRYINAEYTKEKNPYFWRDTHMRIEGITTFNLQYTFLTDWNFSAQQNIKLEEEYFPIQALDNTYGDKFVQTLGSGPDSDFPIVMYALMEAMNLAKKQILITTPYFIPDQAFIDAMKIAALSGIDVRLMVPGVSDSHFVNAVARSYYEDLMKAGITIYQYNKGFIHAKTLICDDSFSMVSTVNLDQRSFNLNFEMASFIYDKEFAQSLKDSFFEDVKDCITIQLDDWENRPFKKVFGERLARLFAPLM